MEYCDYSSVDSFAEAMKEKMFQKSEKGYSGWRDCPPDNLRKLLTEHIEKGDPIDVANFCMMLWCLDEGTVLIPK